MVATAQLCQRGDDDVSSASRISHRSPPARASATRPSWRPSQRASSRSTVTCPRPTSSSAAEDRADLDERLALLDDREREVVYLRFFVDLTQGEIAERLGISQMHVSRILRGALETMRRRADQ